ncbi:MAG: hypothetical protein KDB06_14345, partial [Ilumatobacter sp.]|nr:hypothetical protein [Ilumatobacter sp.]
MSSTRRVSYEVQVGVIVAAGMAYVVGLGWAMANLSYDLWGALVAVPLIALVMVPLVARIFRSDRTIARVAYAGLALKLGGTIARYWVAFDAYGGAADSQDYHDRGRLLAAQIRDGSVGPWTIVPHGTGTDFIRNLTGSIYTVVGSSKLAGFLWFAALGYLGTLLCIKAATLFGRTFDGHRYAILCVISPTLVFWPSSIGKESWMMLCLGLTVFGAARLFTSGRIIRPLLWVAAGVAGAAFVRPHIAFIWVGAGVVGVLWSAIGSLAARSQGRAPAVFATVVGIGGLFVVGNAALRFLPSGTGDDSLADRITTAFDETLRRTSGGGSEFSPPGISSPLNYPGAILRTITRPLLFEANSISTLLPALETTALI